MKPPNRKKTATTTSCSCCSKQSDKAKKRSAALSCDTMNNKTNKRKKLHTQGRQSPLLDNPVAQDDEMSQTLPLPLDTHCNNLYMPQLPGQHSPSTPPDFQSPGLGNVSIADDTSSDSQSEEEEDDVLPNLQQVIANHSQNLLPGNGVQFAEPISTPIVSQIKKSICKDIWRHKFVDMASLLPSSHNPQTPQFTLQIDHHSNFTINPTSRTRKITNVESWTTAFIRFMAVYTVKYPAEFQQLLKYTEIVRDIARRRPGLAFLYYDSQFRMLRESFLMPWDRIHTEYWLMACTSFQPNPQSFRNLPQSTRPHPTSGTKRFLEKTCWNFNKRSQCHNPKCSHPHICGFCRGSHPAYNCKYSSKEHAAKALSQSSTPSSSKSSK